jgi:hypothetical protein
MSAYVKNTERCQMNNLMVHLNLEKQWQGKPKVSRRKEIIKIMAKNNKMEIKKNTKNQQYKKLVFWKNKDDQQIPGKSE